MATNGTGRSNRVRPDGTLVADAARGTWWGNRGQLLDRHGDLVRYSRGRLWIICQLSFKGRQRTQWQPGRLTELYFLDEATGLAAGHRPCGECRAPEYRAFKTAWPASHPTDERAGDIDARLHADRLQAPGRPRTHTDDVANVPAGTMIATDGGFGLVWADRLWPWSTGGYGAPRPVPTGRVTVVTPATTVEAIRNGYRPHVHPTVRTP